LSYRACKPSKDAESLVSSFDFFVGNIVSGIGLSLFGQGFGPWAPTAKGKYFSQVFSGN